jgi:long-chain acyl-CoA synthetase
MSGLKTLRDIFIRGTETFYNKPLFGTKIAGEWRWCAYSEFAHDVHILAGGMAYFGIKTGDRVAIISNNSREWATIAYAALSLGAAYVPMYEKQSVEDWEHILADCGARLVFVANEEIQQKVVRMAPRLDNLFRVSCIHGKDGQVGYRQMLFDGMEHRPSIHHIAPEDLACILYTSGTTGKPKGVELTHGNIVSNVTAVRKIMPLDSSDRCLSFLPWAHSFGGTCELHTFISIGASIGICEGIDKILDNLAEVKPTVLCAVPRIFNGIYSKTLKKVSSVRVLPIRRLLAGALSAANKKRQGKRLSYADRMSLRLADRLIFSGLRKKLGGRLKYAFSGGAKLDAEVAEFIDTAGIEVYEGYGLTETSPIVTCNRPWGKKIGSVGLALEGVRVVINRSEEGGSEKGEGEIVVYGPNVMRGYHNLPEETARVMTEDGGFRTGDKGRIDKDGFLWVTGRYKEEYKLENGKYIVPSSLEEKLKLSTYIANVLVYGDNRPYNVALVVPDQEAVDQWISEQWSDPSRLSDSERESALRKLIEMEMKRFSSSFKGFEQIRNYALVKDFTQDNGLLTPTLKVKRNEVIKNYSEALELLYI